MKLGLEFWTSALLWLIATASARADNPLDLGLLVSSFNTDQVLRYNLAGGFVGVAASGGGLDGPTGLAVDSSGVLYVGSRGTKEILKYNPTNGVFLGVFTTMLGRPEGLTFGQDLNGDGVAELYVANRDDPNDRVEVYDGVTGTLVTVLGTNSPPHIGNAEEFFDVEFYSGCCGDANPDLLIVSDRTESGAGSVVFNQHSGGQFLIGKSWVLGTGVDFFLQASPLLAPTLAGSPPRKSSSSPRLTAESTFWMETLRRFFLRPD